jgi:hypothetical protein
LNTRNTRRLLTAGLTLLVACGLAAAPSAAPKPEKHFRAALTPDQEVGSPVRVSDAFGTATVKIDPHDRWFDIKVKVGDISNVSLAHIHLGPAGSNGPVRVDLYAADPGGGPFHGELVDLRIFPGQQSPAISWADLLAAIRAGNTYVNVHTNDGNPMTNNTAGDYPGGEIRGQLLPK